MLATRSKRSVVWNWDLKFSPYDSRLRARFLTTASSQTPVDQQSKMEPIKDADIESSWAEHFPRRLVNRYSKTVLRLYLFDPEPQSSTRNYSTARGWSKKLRFVLRKFGVPKNHRVKSECNFTRRRRSHRSLGFGLGREWIADFPGQSSG